MFKKADSEGRPLTKDEEAHVEDLLDRAQQHHAVEKRFREIDPGGAGNSVHRPDRAVRGR